MNEEFFNVKTGEVEKEEPLTPNYIKLLDLFVKNYKHHKLDDKERFLDEADINNLNELVAEYGELQIINLLADDLIVKQKIINMNKVGLPNL